MDFGIQIHAVCVIILVSFSQICLSVVHPALPKKRIAVTMHACLEFVVL